MNLLENSDGICADVRSPTIDDIITFQGRSFKPDLINLAFLGNGVQHFHGHLASVKMLARLPEML